MPRDTYENPGPAALARDAARCRRLADSLTDERTVETLRLMARDYEQRATGRREEA